MRFKSFRVMTPLLLALLFSFTALASDFNEVENRLRDLENTMNSMVNSIVIDVNNRTVKFPEYEEVFKDYLNRIQAGSDNYKSTLTNIKTFIETELSKAYSELKSLEDLYAANPSRPLKRMLEEKRSRIKDVTATLVRQVNDHYKNALVKLYTLDGKLVYPATKLPNPRALFWAFAAIPVFGTIPTVVFMTDRDLKHKVYGYKVSDNVGRAYVAYNDWKYITRDSYNQKVSKATERIYGNCKTAACVFFAAEDYIHWSKSFEKINKDVQLMKGVTLEKISTISSRKAKRLLNKHADNAAKALPIANFE